MKKPVILSEVASASERKPKNPYPNPKLAAVAYRFSKRVRTSPTVRQNPRKNPGTS
ncbi:MAG TPA: hypothetical protein VGG14_06745 [Candidatus Sulfotelmatobacter sp.]|jgi:hypothetical protein